MKPSKSESPFIRALRSHFDKKRYTILTQVEIPSGAGVRMADALVLGKFNAFDPSIQGFEIKATRVDWLSEMKNPLKAESGAAYCDGWSLLTYPGMADPEEVPPAWGHWVLDKEIKILKEAPSLQPKPVDRIFLTRLIDAVVAQAGQNIDLLSSQADYDRGFADGKEKGYDEADQAQGYFRSQLTRQVLQIEDLASRLRAFGAQGFTEEEIGSIKTVAKYCRQWGPHRMGDLLRGIELFVKANPENLRKELEDLHAKASDIKSMLEQRLNILSDLSEVRSSSAEVPPQESKEDES